MQYRTVAAIPGVVNLKKGPKGPKWKNGHWLAIEIDSSRTGVASEAYYLCYLTYVKN